jgi:hypothetical protein
VLGVVATVGVARERNLQRPDWRPVARALGRPPAGGRMILVQHYRDLLPLSLYQPHLKFLRAPGARVSELDVVSFSSPRSAGFCWWGSACNLWPSRMQAGYAIPGFTAAGRTRRGQFTILRLTTGGGGRFVSADEVSRSLQTTNFQNDELLIQP